MVGQQLSERVSKHTRVAGGHDPRGPCCRHLGEAADIAEQQWLAECERCEQHARLVGLEVGENDEVGALEIGRQLFVGYEVRVESNVRGSACAERGDVHLRHPGDPQLGVFDRLLAVCPSPRVEQDVDALVGAHQAEQEHDG
jgi:hypothetical protein